MERRFNLSIDAGEEGLRNLPMYNTYKIDIYKGIDNRFELSIRNNDRKSVSINDDATVVFSLVSEDKSKKYDYEATPTKPALGLYEVVIPEFDLRSIEIGSYFGHIIVKQDGIEEPLYTTQDFYPFADVVVHENKFNTTSQAVEISGDSFTREVIQDEITGKFYEIFTSEPIKASKAPTHSILVELVEFVGDVVIEQCLREDPDPESWTELAKREYEIDEDGKRFDGLDIFVFSAVTEYVRIKWKREQGDEANLLNITYRPETMTGGAVASVNSKVGDVVLTGEDIKTVSGEDTKTIAETVDAIDVNFEVVSERIDGIGAVIPETANKENMLVDKTTLDDALAMKQDKLAAGENIEITDENEIRVKTASGLLVESINGVGGVLSLNGENIPLEADGEGNILAAIQSKQDAITVDTDIIAGKVSATELSVSADKTTAEIKDAGITLTSESIFIGDNDGYGLLSGNWSATMFTAGNLVSNVSTINYISNVGSLEGGSEEANTGAFNWYMNTTTDFNKFNVWNRYWVTSTDSEGVETKTPTDTLVISAGGSPYDHSTWIDFTANYLSFKGSANFGTESSHTMSFNGTSTFTEIASFNKDVYLGMPAYSYEDEAGVSHNVTATNVSVRGELTCQTGFGTLASCPTHISGDVTFWLDQGDGSTVPAMTYNHLTGAFSISNVKTEDPGSVGNRISWECDSRKTDTFGMHLGMPLTNTATMPAESDSSNVVPTTEWVQKAIAASKQMLPADITGKTLELYNSSTSGTLRFNDSGLTLQDSLGYMYFAVNSAGTLTCSTPNAGDNSNKAATTAFVQTELSSKVKEAAISYQSVNSTRYVIREEITTTGKLCTVHWHGAASNETAITVEIPEAFSNGIVMSVVITPETAGGAGCTASLTGTTLTATPALTTDGNISLVITIFHEV